VVTTVPRIVLYVQPAFQVPGYGACCSGSPFAIKIGRVLRYKRLPFQVEEVGWLERPERLPALSRSGKLPVLDYADRRLEDSTAMAYFLEERHPEPRLVPTDAYARAHMHLVEDWADEALYYYGLYGTLKLGGQTTIPHLLRKLPKDVEEPFEARLRAYLEQILHHQGVGRYPAEKFRADLTRSLDALDAVVAREGFTVGPTLTLADLAVFGQLKRYFLSGTQPDLEREVKARHALLDWVGRVDAASA
jgi:glutathione S-transferase